MQRRLFQSVLAGALRGCRTFVAGAAGLAVALTLAASQPLQAAPVVSIDVDQSPIEEGETLTITGTVLEQGNPVTCGTIKIFYQYVDDGQTADAEAYVDLASGTPDANGQFSAQLVVTGDASQYIALRVFYQSTGPHCDFDNVTGGTAPTLNVDIVGSSACAPGSDPVLIGITAASGNGTPAPGESGPWSYRVSVRACEDVSHVSAQGGSNGWATSFAYSTNDGVVVVSKKNKNEVATWLIGSLSAGSEATLDITVNGTIKNSNGECGKTKSLNGAWSALYSIDGGQTIEKSAYTVPNETVTLLVTCLP